MQLIECAPFEFHDKIPLKKKLQNNKDLELFLMQ
jgi:hypothetical protein